MKDHPGVEVILRNRQKNGSYAAEAEVFSCCFPDHTVVSGGTQRRGESLLSAPLPIGSGALMCLFSYRTVEWR